MADEFDWDEANVGHLARHVVAPSEVEEVFERDPISAPDDPVDGEERWNAYGITAKGRMLTVVYTMRGEKTRPSRPGI